MRNDIKIVYMGTSEFSSRILQYLLDNNVKVVGVVSQPDKEVGRKRIPVATAVKQVALNHNIDVFQPLKIRNDYEWIKEKNPDIILTCAYGQIVPQGVLDIPNYKCINIHGSLLPKYRGAAPVQYAILNGDKETGITYMEMIKEMDAGCMYQKCSVDIDCNDTSDDVFDKLYIAVKESIIEFLDNFVEGKIVGEEQNIEEVTFTKMIKREDELIDWNDSVKNIHNKVRAYYSSPCAYTILDNVEIKILKGRLTDEKTTSQAGVIVDAKKDGIYVACNDGVYVIERLQVSGKKPMDSRDYLNGNKDIKGKRFYVREVL